MSRVVMILGLGVLLASSCNPAARCRSGGDCSSGVCSGGFCTDLSGVTGGGSSAADRDAGANATDRVDFDDPDAAVALGNAVPDAGVETNGRP